MKMMEEYEKQIEINVSALINEFFVRFISNNKKPKNFYQYSAISSFKGVVENNNMWATHWAYLNDAKELKCGVEIVKKVFLEMERNKKDLKLKSQYFDILKSFVSYLNKDDAFDKTDVYILCFTEKKDQLSQWRGYGRGYNSIVVNYNPACLKIGEHSIGTPLMGKVIYDEDQQKKIMVAYLFRIYKMIDEIHKRFPKQKKAAEAVLFGDFMVGILTLSLFMKEKCWCEEKEWRVILNDGVSNSLDFKETNKGFVPYVKVPIFKEHAIKCIKDVRLPKSSDFTLRKKAIEMLWRNFCSKNGIKKDLVVNQSSISIVY
jgi:hypothetical protein